jgi:hypothetical protein
MHTRLFNRSSLLRNMWDPGVKMSSLLEGRQFPAVCDPIQLNRSDAMWICVRCYTKPCTVARGG